MGVLVGKVNFVSRSYDIFCLRVRNGLELVDGVGRMLRYGDITFRVKCFVNDRALSPKIAGNRPFRFS